jgi:hypothetical protein
MNITSSGTVRFAFYKNGGKYKKQGLGNKRNAHWARIRKLEMFAEERRIQAEERAQREWEEQLADYSEYQ